MGVAVCRRRDGDVAANVVFVFGFVFGFVLVFVLVLVFVFVFVFVLYIGKTLQTPCFFGTRL